MYEQCYLAFLVRVILPPRRFWIAFLRNTESRAIAQLTPFALDFCSSKWALPGFRCLRVIVLLWWEVSRMLRKLQWTGKCLYVAPSRFSLGPCHYVHLEVREVWRCFSPSILTNVGSGDPGQLVRLVKHMALPTEPLYRLHLKRNTVSGTMDWRWSSLDSAYLACMRPWPPFCLTMKPDVIHTQEAGGLAVPMHPGLRETLSQKKSSSKLHPLNTASVLQKPVLTSAFPTDFLHHVYKAQAFTLRHLAGLLTEWITHSGASFWHFYTWG